MLKYRRPLQFVKNRYGEPKTKNFIILKDTKKKDPKVCIIEYTDMSSYAKSVTSSFVKVHMILQNSPALLK